MAFNPYLSFNGSCAEAFAFYAAATGGNVVSLLTYRNSPAADQAPPDWQGKVMHASLVLGDTVLMGGDVPPGQYQPPVGFSVNITVPSAAEAERVFAALGAGGSIMMPMAETFWAERFGMATDRFGIPWMVNCMKPMPAAA